MAVASKKVLFRYSIFAHSLDALPQSCVKCWHVSPMHLHCRKRWGYKLGTACGLTGAQKCVGWGMDSILSRTRCVFQVLRSHKATLSSAVEQLRNSFEKDRRFSTFHEYNALVKLASTKDDRGRYEIRWGLAGSEILQSGSVIVTDRFAQQIFWMTYARSWVHGFFKTTRSLSNVQQKLFFVWHPQQHGRRHADERIRSKCIKDVWRSFMIRNCLYLFVKSHLCCLWSFVWFAAQLLTSNAFSFVQGDHFSSAVQCLWQWERYPMAWMADCCRWLCLPNLSIFPFLIQGHRFNPRPADVSFAGGSRHRRFCGNTAASMCYKICQIFI